MSASTLWVVGRCVGDCADDDRWQIEGVYSTESAAVARCRDWTYFVGPMTLDEGTPDEVPWVGAYYPLVRG